MDGNAGMEWLDRVAGLSPADAARARRLAQETGEPLTRALRRLGTASDPAIADALATAHGLPRIGAADFPDAPPDGIGVAPDFLRESWVIPVGRSDNAIRLAVADPTDSAGPDGVRLASGAEVEIAIATFADIEAAIARWYGEGDNRLADALSGEAGEHDAESLKDLASEAPVVRLVNSILAEALKSRASDIHIEPFRDRLRLRFRIDGVLQERPSPPAALSRLVASRVKILAGLDIAERRRPQDGRARIAVAGRALDLRVATAPTAHGESITIRLLEDRDTTVSLESVGLSDTDRDLLLHHLEAPYGLVLVTGPTGSGKTTTLAGALSKLNAPGRKLISIEDPVEYQIEGVNQIAVNPAIGLTFAAVLRSVLRHDPDIIVVGELRDGETAEIAVNAALTGHLVLATVHTNTAAGAAPRLIDMGVDPALLRSTLRLAIAQRLVRMLCPECKTPVEPPEGLSQAFEATGCAACDNTGYRGRSGVFEFIEIDSAISEALRDGVSSHEIEKKARKTGSPSILDDARDKIEAGLTSPSEVRRVLGGV
ncbi:MULTISPECIES: GspE/PulE family protein [Hyphobacterium]|uniref:GspE/PulE family protein n=1 Tax=Hyphobacterium vulgare TaxID=1736751 RepID=A0ABV6ZVC2_9PROT